MRLTPARETYEYSARMEIRKDEAAAILREAERFVLEVKNQLKSLKPLGPPEPIKTFNKMVEEVRVDPKDPFLARLPRGKSGLEDLSRKHDEYLHGKKKSHVSS